MSSDIERIIWNTRERIASNDFNDATDLQNRATIEALASTLDRKSGVVYGLQVTTTGIGLNATVSPGLALYDTSTPTPNDSAFQWIELMGTEDVVLPPADAVNPRWDVIEIQANDVVEVSSLRDVFNPALGTFTPQTLVKRRGSEPILSVRSGIASATPQYPAGVDGVIPLAYVYVPAGVAVVPTGSEVLCRPILRTNPDLLLPSEVKVTGGGITAAAVPAVGGVITIGATKGQFDDGTPFEIAAETSFVPNDAGSTTPYPNVVNDQLYHVYATKVRYPALYSPTLAPREFVPGVEALAGIGGGVAAGVQGCLITVQESNINTVPNPNTAQGEPAAAFNIPSSQAGIPTTFIPATDAVYLGSFLTDFDGATSDLQLQATRGAEVTGNFIAAIQLDQPSPQSIWTTAFGTGLVVPPTALVVNMVLSIAVANVGDFVGQSFAEDPSFGSDRNFLRFQLEGSPAGLVEVLLPTGPLRPEPGTGNFVFGLTGGSTPAPAPAPRVTLVSYQDSCLALR